MLETTLSWTPANWLTVMIMVIAGYALLGLASQTYKRMAPAAG